MFVWSPGRLFLFLELHFMFVKAFLFLSEHKEELFVWSQSLFCFFPNPQSLMFYLGLGKVKAY